MTSRSLVTGASGFLGRHLVRALLADERPTFAICRRPETLADLGHPALTVAAADVRDPVACAGLLAGIDTVFHLAAVRNRSGSSPAEMYELNELATARLARQAIAAGARRFVHVSTALVFGPSATPLDESAPLAVDEASAGPYVASKARAVVELRRLAREGAPVAIVHPTIVYGPDHPSHPNRITAQIRRLLRRRVDLVVGGGRAERDLAHVDDVVAALLAVAKSQEPNLELLVNGGPVSQRGLAELVADAAGRRPPLVVSIPVPAARLLAAIADRALGRDPLAGATRAVGTLSLPWRFRSVRCSALLGRQPRSVAQGVAETVAWIRSDQ